MSVVESPWILCSLSVVPVVMIVLLAFLYIRICYLPYQVLKRHGIPGPTPSFFYGHYDKIAKLGTIKYLEQLHKQYGSLVGYYLGKMPVISVMDTELIKLITVKNSETFINRPRLPGYTDSIPGLVFTRDEEWRTARRTLTPTFSALKMKAMTPLIEDSVKTLVDVFQQHANSKRSVEIFTIFCSFTMESILATAFGRVIGIQRGEASELTEAAAEVFAGGHEERKTSERFMITLFSNAPWLAPIVKILMKNNRRIEGGRLLYNTALQLIQERRAMPDGGGKFKDLLQLMIDATIDGSTNKLTDDEIARHSLTFMLAGQETTANALSYTVYLLALNPLIQEQLQKEIDQYFEENPKVSAYEAAQNLKYVDMVLHEAMRLYPPFPIIYRECARSYAYKGITVPKGATFEINASLMHRMPEFWKDPEKFDPLRFSSELKAQRPQHCYLPFGSGPRSCIGMRFALLEAKIALIELFKKFSVIKTSDTEVPLETILGLSLSPKNGIHLEITTRH